MHDYCERRERSTKMKRFKERNKALKNGFKSLGKWFIFTVFLSGFPLLLYIILCFMFGIDEERGITEIAAFFFGIATPVLFEHQVGIKVQDNVLAKIVKYAMAVVFVFFCMFYGYVYIKDFRGEKLTTEELASCRFLILSFGSGSFILTGISQFVGGYYSEECK